MTWAATAGTARWISAEAVRYDFGDQDLIVATFQHKGRPPHSISLTADHNYGGLFRQAIVGVDPEAVRKAWAKISTQPLQPIAAAELAARWAAGTGVYRLYAGAPVDEAVIQIIPLLEARAAALPAAPRPADKPKLDAGARRAFISAFVGSSQASANPCRGRRCRAPCRLARRLPEWPRRGRPRPLEPDRCRDRDA